MAAWRAQAAGASAGGSDRFVYQDQLQEIDRDRAAGLIGEAEAESARIEISRRLLAAADAETRRPPRRQRRRSGIAALRRLPRSSSCRLSRSAFMSGSARRSSGAVRLSRAPMQPPGDQSIASLVSQVEAHLARDPNDGDGWEVIAPVYLRMGRFDDAVMARRKAIALNGDSAERESDLGEALVAAANGVVTDEAEACLPARRRCRSQRAEGPIFSRSCRRAGRQPRRGRRQMARLLESAPPNAPWASFVARGAGARHRGAGRRQAARAPSDCRGRRKHDRRAAHRDDPRHGAAACRPAARRWQRRRRLACAWCVPMSYSATATRRRMPPPMPGARWSDHPDEVKRIDDLVKGLGLEG